MTSYYIGVSGLSAAQKALSIIGNNMANAATEGYHKQRVELSPAYAAVSGQVVIGGGVNFEGVTRLIDNLLEKEIMTEQSLLEHIQREYDTLRTIESSFGELSESGGLNTSIDNFFNAIQDFSANPNELVWQSQLVNAAEIMAGKFRTLSGFLTNLKNQMTFEIRNTVEQINTLSGRIAELNNNIKRVEVGGVPADNLRDQRDQCIAELAKLAPVETVSRDFGVVDVTVAGMPVVSETNALKLEAGLEENGKTGIGIAGSYVYYTDIQGGKIGGLLSLANEIVAGIEDNLDELAAAIIEQINQIHVQGVGSFGSFGELSGWKMNSENLSEFEMPVSDGKIYIRITNTSTGQVSREEIDVDASTDTLTSIAAKISAISGLSATAASSRIVIAAEPGYKFDFSPAVLPEPTAGNLTAASPPEISVTGEYEGDTNQTFVCTVVSGGFVGNDVVQIEVRNGAGELVKTLNVGAGYAAGDYVELADGVRVSLGQGQLNAGDSFEVAVFSDTDTSGFLAATGLNCFFAGSDASDISVFEQITEQPSRIASSAGPEMTDNVNAMRMFALRNTSLSSLGNVTIGDFYRDLVTGIGLETAVKQAGSDSMEGILKELKNRQSEMSGVDINEEAAQLLIFEKMFQAMAKYISTVQSTLSSLMEII